MFFGEVFMFRQISIYLVFAICFSLPAHKAQAQEISVDEYEAVVAEAVLDELVSSADDMSNPDLGSAAAGQTQDDNGGKKKRFGWGNAISIGLKVLNKDIDGAKAEAMGVAKDVGMDQLCQIRRSQCLGSCNFSGGDPPIDPLWVACMLAQCISSCPTC